MPTEVQPGHDLDHLWRLANQDSLTGLFNRRRFFEELEREVAVAKRGGELGAVLMLDLDRFKDVNDSLGHMAGDTLLVRVADALRSRLRATDTLARLGGDEFAIVLPACPPEAAQRVARQLAEQLSEVAAIKIAGRERKVTASIGIAPFGDRPDEDAGALMVEADLAMYRAKRAGPGGIEAFDEQMRAELAARLRVEVELRGAVELDQLRVLYQPIVSIGDGSPVGCEALVRWQHPVRGTVPPAEFVPIAEEYGLIEDIGAWVLDRACERARRWRREGINVYVAVNVSPLQLIKTDIVGVVSAALDSARLPAELLCLEVTETALLDDPTPMVPALRRLSDIGVRLAIDDFGGGASSLGLLRMLPLDVIKIDRVFIQGLAERSDDRAIVAAVLSLADELDLQVVAEGVEEDRQHWELRELGCGYAQGFLYSRPAPAGDLELGAYTAAVQPGIGDPYVIREFMRQIGIPARVGR